MFPTSGSVRKILLTGELHFCEVGKDRKIEISVANNLNSCTGKARLYLDTRNFFTDDGTQLRVFEDAKGVRYLISHGVFYFSPKTGKLVNEFVLAMRTQAKSRRVGVMQGKTDRLLIAKGGIHLVDFSQLASVDLESLKAELGANGERLIDSEGREVSIDCKFPASRLFSKGTEAVCSIGQ